MKGEAFIGFFLPQTFHKQQHGLESENGRSEPFHQAWDAPKRAAT
jgi:hypothetical protein